MASGITRRGVLGGIAASTGTMAFSRAPESSVRPLPRGQISPVPTRPLATASERLINRAGLGGDVTFAVSDVKSGEILEARSPTTFMPPASTLKVVTALYAFDRLGRDYRFQTVLAATGPITAGKLEGDLLLIGGGDPTLDTDRLADLALGLKAAGVTEITGKFRVWAGALPEGDRIDAGQPEHLSFNPAYGGLNLNFNRVHFQWMRAADKTYDITMHARAARFSPATNVASMSVVDRSSPVFDHWSNGQRDHWSVARNALGRNGARWLPVRHPARYAGDVFRTLVRSNGIVLPPAEIAMKSPSGVEIARVESDMLVPLMQGMLKYSTNLTAEIAGMAATQASAKERGTSLAESAREMARFVARSGAGRVSFSDHSGLSDQSAITAGDMVRLLTANTNIAPLMKTVNLSLDKARPAPEGVEVRAKTGSLNFVSTLAGFVETRTGRQLSFAFFSADLVRRAAVPLTERESPRGSKGWARRSRQLQKELLRNWALLYA